MLKLLVPVGQSQRSLQAVRHAAFLYHERCASEVVLVNVQPPLESTRLEAFHSLAKLRQIEHDFRKANSPKPSASSRTQTSNIRSR